MVLLDLLFPRRCFGCGRLGAYVCMRCAKDLRIREAQTCLYCGRPSLYGLTHPACRKPNGVDAAVSLYYYNNTMKRVLAGVKYRLVRDALPDLLFIIGRRAHVFTGFFMGMCPAPVLSPLPLSPGRLRERGFNQAAAIGQMFSWLYGIPSGDFLVKTKETAPQAMQKGTLPRRKNVSGAFAVREGAPVPERIILIDDVVTSGETVREAAKTAKKAGAKKAYVLSVAKG